MKFQIGQQVRFLNEVGGGRIVTIDSQGYYVVQTEDGFEIPTLAAELVAVNSSSPYGAYNPAQPKAPAPPPPPVKKPPVQVPLLTLEGVRGQIILAFAPKDPIDPVKGPFDVRILNAQPYNLLATVSRPDKSRQALLFAGKVEAHASRSIGTLDAAWAASNGELSISLLYYQTTPYEPLTPDTFQIRVQGVRFQRPGGFPVQAPLGCPALYYHLRAEHDELALRREMQARIADGFPLPSADEPDLPPSRTAEEIVVDLHQEQLGIPPHTLRPHDVMKEQLAEAERSLRDALKSNSTQRVVLIHGAGHHSTGTGGRLRLELEALLRSKFPKLTFQDASWKEYGYGALLVYLSNSN